MWVVFRKIFTRTNLLAAITVLLLFAVLPLAQRAGEVATEDTLVIREVDTAPPPPPPPPQRQQEFNATGGSNGGISLDALPTGVRLLPVSIGSELGAGYSTGIGSGGFDVGARMRTTFSMEGVGFGADGLDRPPVMLVKPEVPGNYMQRNGIYSFDVEVMVKLRQDGSLVFISIESISNPDPELAKLARDVVPRIRYSRPTVDGQPVERIVRLPLTIIAR